MPTLPIGGLFLSVLAALAIYVRAEKKARAAENEKSAAFSRFFSLLLPDQEYVEWMLSPLQQGSQPVPEPIAAASEPIAEFVRRILVPVVSPQTAIQQTIEQLYSSQLRLVVVAGSPVIGTIAESDVVASVRIALRDHNAINQLTADAIAQKHFVKAYPTDTIHQVLKTMLERRLGRLVVFDENEQPVGFVTRMQLIKAVRERILVASSV